MQKPDKNYFAWGLTAFFVIAASLLCTFLVFNFSRVMGLLSSLMKILTPIIDGIALAYVLTPVLNGVERSWITPLYKKLKVEMTPQKIRARRRWSILVTVVLVVAFMVVFFRVIIPQLILSIQSIIFQLPLYLNNLGDLFARLLDNNPDLASSVDSLYDMYSAEFTDFVQNNILPQVNQLIKTLTSGIFNFVKGTFNFIVGFIISIYLMFSKETLSAQAKKIVYSFYEVKSANRIISGIRYTHKTFIGFLGGKIIDSIIIGILTAIVTNIVGTPYAVLISVIVGITNVIPFFGPYIGAIPSTLIVLMVDPMQALYFVIIILIIQQIDGNIIGPKILGDSTGLSSFWVIFSITLFGGIFGVAGMILGVPTFAVIYAFARYKINRRLRHKSLPTDTSLYTNLGSIDNDGSFLEYVPVKGRSVWDILGFTKGTYKKRELILDDDETEQGTESSVTEETKE